jgi:TonB family protein
MTLKKTVTLLAALLLAPAMTTSRAHAEEKAVTDQEIKSTVGQHMSEIKSCMSKHGTSSGKVIVEFAIEKDGHVSMSKVSHDSSNHPLDECIAGLFKHWTFPKPRGGAMWLSNYPLIFSVPKEAPKGTLSSDDIVKTVTAHTPDVQACLTEEKKDKPDVSGTAELGIVVSPAGKVTDVKVLSTDTKAPKLDACIVGKVKAWAFPKPQGGGEASFRYPFKLNLK